MCKPYPSDITREQFSLIEEDLEGAKKTPSQELWTYTIYFALY